MKVIDILNKINNNEEVPEKVKFDDTIFEYDKRQEEYNHQKDNGLYETLLYRVMSTHFIDVLLRAEVEVIEENKQIEELEISELDRKVMAAFIIKNREKINELVRAVNKINKQLEEQEAGNMDEMERQLNKMFKEREEK